MQDKSWYTLGQKAFLKLDSRKFTDEDLEVLRIMLLPRNHYLPKTEDECAMLSRQILNEESYALFSEFRDFMCEHLGVQGEWGKGRKNAILQYRFRLRGKTLCSVALCVDNPKLEITLGASEQKKFERVRHTFSKKDILWSYDDFGDYTNYKLLIFSLSDRRLWGEYLRIVRLKF